MFQIVERVSSKVCNLNFLIYGLFARSKANYITRTLPLPDIKLWRLDWNHTRGTIWRKRPKIDSERRIVITRGNSHMLALLIRNNPAKNTSCLLYNDQEMHFSRELGILSEQLSSCLAVSCLAVYRAEREFGGKKAQGDSCLKAAKRRSRKRKLKYELKKQRNSKPII